MLLYLTTERAKSSSRDHPGNSSAPRSITWDHQEVLGWPCLKAPRSSRCYKSSTYCSLAGCSLSTWHLIVLGALCGLGFLQKYDSHISFLAVVLSEWGERKSVLLWFGFGNSVLLQQYSIGHRVHPSWGEETQDSSSSAHLMMRRMSKHLWPHLIHHEGKFQFGKVRKSHTGKLLYKLVWKDMEHLKWVGIKLKLSISTYK